MMKSDKSYLFVPFRSTLECALYSLNLNSLWISTYDEFSWYEQWEAHSTWSSYVLSTDITQGVLASKFPIQCRIIYQSQILPPGAAAEFEKT